MATKAETWVRGRVGGWHLVGTKYPGEEDIAVVVSDGGEGEDENAAEGQRRLAEILSTYAAFRTLPSK